MSTSEDKVGPVVKAQDSVVLMFRLLTEPKQFHISIDR